MKKEVSTIKKEKEQLAVTTVLITNIEWANLFNCMKAMPGSRIQKNMGTAFEPLMAERGWTSKHISVFRENRKKLEEHFEELFEKENNLKSLRERITKEALGKSSSSEALRSASNYMELKTEMDELKDEKLALPVLEKIAASEIQGYEITGNDYIGAFWEWCVDYNK
jgi:hypothetical protein